MSINNHLKIKTEPQITTLELFPLEKSALPSQEYFTIVLFLLYILVFELI